MNKLVCIVGMPGSGKSVVSDFLVRRGYGYVRFGQINLDIIKQRGLQPTEQNEKKIRLEVREKHGMGAHAVLNLPKFEELLKKGNVVGDGLYGWSEYKILKDKYADRLIVIAVYAPPEMRYARLSNRKLSTSDTDLRNRPISPKDAKSRDYAEIEQVEKGGPIAMADYTLINTGSTKVLFGKLKKIIEEVEKL